ncbi:MoxR-like ATPase [Caloramator quimbayensis]|uniref:MoxR-like ATPase n=1 Tax=Caloramator quimbayensis TaxID=1147123 RepID=A0A1T4WW84_9CLOT|nr:MoxR family ATPase [Caloramator quimbayensis]SKA81135.1 MoxR-like ATPase [Caloramator quimbayensis]
MDLNAFVNFKEKIIQNVSKVIVGKKDVIELVTISFICGGHVLLEDIPGVGKTMLIRAFSNSLGCDFKRIQFTPDLLPSDITGINFYNQKSCEFEFRKGPLFTNIVLADEINRATPRTQSSLLEAMEEKQITIDGQTHRLNEPFMVLSTQNPVESYGTFPLPEAQLDRFFMRISMGYPKREDEIEVVYRNKNFNLINEIKPVITLDEILYVKNNFSKVDISKDVMDYIMDIIEETRRNEKILLGVSPRGTIALFRACQAKAAIEGRDFIIPEDVKMLSPYVLNHRIITKGLNKANNIEIINHIIDSIKAPVEDF